MSIQDLVVILFVLFGFLIGLTQSTIKKVFRIAILTLCIVVVYYFITPGLTDYLRYEPLSTFGIKISVTINGSMFSVESVNDIFTTLSSLGVSSDILASVCEGFVKIIIFAALLIVTIPVSLVISGLLWHLLFKWFIPKKIRKGGIIRHLLSGILGALEWLVIIILFASSFGQLALVFQNDIIPQLTDAASTLYEFALAAGIDTSMINEILSMMTYVVNMLSPYSEDSVILPYIFELLDGFNIDYMSMFTGLVYDEASETFVETSYAESFSYAIDQLVGLISL